ncbi:1,4-alpha-glucan branching enzyme GlgB [Thermogymnomonas acidicola]|uniref:1,4-alpha-glucan branching enzyme GlgB n=2 Tax=Thermogymnomonas acidicola TaxID=399579 RepID=A0AA37BSK7_9ARCH|nr:1,4-alpha-glucan branching enzyme GlgB [Thermogymnomonas acidicola]
MLAMEPVIRFETSRPDSVLGPHTEGEMVRINAYLPLALEAWVETAGGRIGMEEVGEKFFTCLAGREVLPHEYWVCYREIGGYVSRRKDPYSFRPSISDFEIYLYKSGRLYESYRTLGAHIMTIEGVEGVRFAVWAPNARAVSVIGNFNHWKHGAHPMVNVQDSGIWELFVPGIGEGEVYKYAVRWRDGTVKEKADPYAFRTEKRPNTGSVVASLDYEWRSSFRGEQSDASRPMAVYEVHLGSWKRDPARPNDFLSYDSIAEDLCRYVKSMGFTHVEFLPLMEHPLDESWGYQVTSYYAPSARYGDPVGLKRLIDRLHSEGIGVILDWVPAHFPDDDFSLSRFDGTHLYDHEDPRLGRHPDWGTRIFNYGRNEVRNFLISSALFWLNEYRADGLRIDAVSSMLYLDYSRKPGEWIPNRYGGRENLEAIEFLRELSRAVKQYRPDAVLIAEESTAWPGVTRTPEEGGLGFDYKWNMGWMHDTLDYFSRDPIYRKYEQDRLTFEMWYAYSERYILPLSHDEVVHGKGSLIGKMPGDAWQKFANLRLMLSYMFMFPGKKLLFMGNEIGQFSEWNVKGQVDWALLSRTEHRGLQVLVRDLLALYRETPALHQGDCDSQGFRWIDFSDRDNSVISFIRRGKGDEVVCVFNMTPVVRHGYRVGVPEPGYYREVFNSDSSFYGGSNTGNMGGRSSERVPFHGFGQSVELTLPPLAAIMLRRD